MVRKGTWVLIRRTVLEKEERPSSLPADTLQTPLKMWIKGHLLEDGSLNDHVRVKTVTGRIEEGELIEVNPAFHHDFGNHVPELQEIDKMVKSLLWDGDHDE